ncbi:MAG: DNA mismatch repair endonuclease MutL, partial [Bacteroidota bacterium]
MSEPGIIRVLPDTLANKIAAGEVVQRPASVAKELLENAIDAGASNVHLVLKQAGRELVQSVDDGCGMSAEDAVMCFRRHATSKIRHADDLLQLYTLGFRGEAMAAIGSVAQVELKTKRVGDEAGTLIRLNGGEMVSNEPCATPNGTSIAVRNLFYNVPARRNFLKSNATEFKHLVETFQFIALSNPDVGFKLTHDGNVVHDLPALSGASIDEALKARIGGLFGDKAAASLVPVGEETSYLSMNGFVAKPEFSRRTRGEQFLFVNGRYIKSRHLDHAVSNAYGDMLPKGSYPFYALFLRVDPQHVDVNVHPTKAEVKFDDERGVYGFVLAVVRKA